MKSNSRVRLMSALGALLLVAPFVLAEPPGREGTREPRERNTQAGGASASTSIKPPPPHVNRRDGNPGPGDSAAPASTTVTNNNNNNTSTPTTAAEDPASHDDLGIAIPQHGGAILTASDSSAVYVSPSGGMQKLPFKVASNRWGVTIPENGSVVVKDTKNEHYLITAQGLCTKLKVP